MADKENVSIVLLKQVPPSLKLPRLKIENVLSSIQKRGFEILEPRWVAISEKEANLLYPSSNEWLEVVGNKVLTNCQEGAIDPIKKFGTSNTIDLGLIAKKWITEYLTSMPLLALEITGKNGDTIQSFRDSLGGTDPSKAAEGTLRYEFRIPGESGVESVRKKRMLLNTAHASDSPKEAKREKGILWEAMVWNPEYE